MKLATTLCALAVMAALPSTANACSDMLLADKSVSPARDVPFTFTQAVVPAGTEMLYLPPAGCEPSSLYGQPSKIGFTCTTFWPEYLVAGTAQECGPQYNASVGLCLDGLNAGGLAVAALGVFQPVDASYSYPNATDPSSDLPALSTFDVAGYMLANFETVEEVDRAMLPSNLQIVDTQGTSLNIPLHWAVADSTGAYGVLELTGPEQWKVVRNPDQVATNWPIPLSQADAARWKEEQIAKHGEVDGPLFEPGFCQVSDPGAAQRSQGQISDDPCDVITRYTVLAMLKNATYLPDAFPKRSPYSPANSPDPTHATIMQGIRILDRVAIPGSWPNNTLTLPTDMTEIQYVRDHLNATIYMRTAGTPRWMRISLPEALQAAEAAGGGARFTPVAQLAPPDEPWALDRSTAAGGGVPSGF